MEIKITENSESRLDGYVLPYYEGVTRSQIKKMIEEGHILVNDKKVKAGYMLKAGDVLTLKEYQKETLSASPEPIELDIVYEDDDLAIINKPQGMVVHPAVGNKSGTMVNALLYHMRSLSQINGEYRPGIVHRLDKNTSGLLVVAKNDFAHASLAKQIAEKTCHRYYLALVDGYIKEEGERRSFLGRDKKNRLKKAEVSEKEGKLAITKYKPVAYYKGYTLVEFQLLTGRTHQIRVHASALNHPIVGDDVYNPHACVFGVKGQLLVAYKLTLVHPRTRKVMTFEIELPEFFKKILQTLEKMES